MKKSNDIQSRRKQLKLRITIVILIFLLAAIGLGVHVVQNYIPSREHMSLTEYYGQPSDGEMVVVLGTDIMEERALKSGDQIYLPQTMVSTYLNQRYYWDSANQQILYATPSALENYPASESGDGDVWLKDGTVYLNLALEEPCCIMLLLRRKREGIYSSLHKEICCIKEKHLGGFYND